MHTKVYDTISKCMIKEMALFLHLSINYCRVFAKKVDFGIAGCLILGFYHLTTQTTQFSAYTAFSESQKRSKVEDCQYLF